jgi:hypothetical protein
VHREPRLFRDDILDAMATKKKLIVAAGILASFAGLAGLVIVLAREKIIGVEMAGLMLVALLGLYVGFGILIALYRLIERLD